MVTKQIIVSQGALVETLANKNLMERELLPSVPEPTWENQLVGGPRTDYCAEREGGSVVGPVALVHIAPPFIHSRLLRMEPRLSLRDSLQE